MGGGRLLCGFLGVFSRIENSRVGTGGISSLDLGISSVCILRNPVIMLSERASEGFGCLAERNILVTVLENDNKCNVDTSHSSNSLQFAKKLT